MQPDNTTQIRNDTQNIQTTGRVQDQPVQQSAGYEDIDPDENEREAAGRSGDDPSDERPPKQHLHFPISLADWGPRNSLL